MRVLATPARTPVRPRRPDAEPTRIRTDAARHRGRFRAAVALVLVVASTSSCRSTNPEHERRAEHTARARAAAEVGDWRAAVEHWGAARHIDPAWSTDAHLGLANGLRALREPRLALDALETGIRLFPDDAELRRSRGRVLAELGFRRAAEVDLVAVTRARADDPLAWCELAQLRATLDEPVAAAETFDRALALEGCPRAVVVAAARANVEAGRGARAHELYVRALDDAPEDTLLLTEAVGAAHLAGRLADARSWARRLTELDPFAVARLRVARSARRVALALVASWVAIDLHGVQRFGRDVAILGRGTEAAAAGAADRGVAARRSRSGVGPTVD